MHFHTLRPISFIIIAQKHHHKQLFVYTYIYNNHYIREANEQRETYL